MISQILHIIEKTSAHLQGKGWGSATTRQEFSQAASLLKDKDVRLCIDIGGNKGTYSEEIIRRYPACDVVIFEPSRHNFGILNQKFAHRGNVRIENLAVSDSEGEAHLYSNEDGSGLASLTKRNLDHFGIDFDRSEEIRTMVFERYWRETLGRRHIALCKIDIEGHELDALKGFGEALQSIDVIQFEFGGCNIDTRSFFQDFWYFFTTNGFELHRISPLGLVKIDRYREALEFFSTSNYLAKRIG